MKFPFRLPKALTKPPNQSGIQANLNDIEAIPSAKLFRSKCFLQYANERQLILINIPTSLSVCQILLPIILALQIWRQMALPSGLNFWMTLGVKSSELPNGSCINIWRFIITKCKWEGKGGASFGNKMLCGICAWSFVAENQLDGLNHHRDMACVRSYTVWKFFFFKTFFFPRHKQKILLKLTNLPRR